MPCRFQLPDRSERLPSRLQVSCTVGTGYELVLERNADPRRCGRGYYIAETASSQPAIALCPATCAALQGQPEARIRIERVCR